MTLKQRYKNIKSLFLSLPEPHCDKFYYLSWIPAVSLNAILAGIVVPHLPLPYSVVISLCLIYGCVWGWYYKDIYLYLKRKLKSLP